MTCLQLADAFTKLLIGAAADRAIASGRLSVLDVRKLLSCSGFIGFAVALLACSLLSDWRFVTAALVSAPATFNWRLCLSLGPFVSDCVSASASGFHVCSLGSQVVGKGFSSLHAPGFKTNYLDLTTRAFSSQNMLPLSLSLCLSVSLWFSLSRFLSPSSPSSLSLSLC